MHVHVSSLCDPPSHIVLKTSKAIDASPDRPVELIIKSMRLFESQMHTEQRIEEQPAQTQITNQPSSISSSSSSSSSSGEACSSALPASELKELMEKRIPLVKSSKKYPFIPHLRVEQIGDGKGKGVRTLVNIPKESDVAEYLGDYISLSEAKSREIIYTRNEVSDSYLMYVQSNKQVW